MENFRNGKANILNCVITNSLDYGIFIFDNSEMYSCRISNCIIEKNINGVFTFNIGTIIVKDNIPEMHFVTVEVGA